MFYPLKLKFKKIVLWVWKILSPRCGLNRKFSWIQTVSTWAATPPRAPKNPRAQIRTARTSFSLRLLENDPTISQLIYANKIWEPHVTRVFEKIIEPGMNVVDIGAHFGYYALLAAKNLKGKGQVYAFEPDRVNFQLLGENIRDNDEEGVVKPYHYAAGDKNEEKELYGFLEGDTSDRLLYSTGKEKLSQSIPCIRLDDFLMNQDPSMIENTQVVKMDIEGYEPYACQGMRRLLASPQIRLFTEINFQRLKDAGSSAEEYLHLLQSFGFKIYLIDSKATKVKLWVRPVNILELSRETENHKDLYCEK